MTLGARNVGRRNASIRSVHWLRWPPYTGPDDAPQAHAQYVFRILTNGSSERSPGGYSIEDKHLRAELAVSECRIATVVLRIKRSAYYTQIKHNLMNLVTFSS